MSDDQRDGVMRKRWCMAAGLATMGFGAGAALSKALTRPDADEGEQEADASEDAARQARRS